MAFDIIKMATFKTSITTNKNDIGLVAWCLTSGQSGTAFYRPQTGRRGRRVNIELALLLLLLLLLMVVVVVMVVGFV